jgi:hypothetical protein
MCQKICIKTTEFKTSLPWCPFGLKKKKKSFAAFDLPPPLSLSIPEGASAGRSEPSIWSLYNHSETSLEMYEAGTRLGHQQFHLRD